MKPFFWHNDIFFNIKCVMVTHGNPNNIHVFRRQGIKGKNIYFLWKISLGPAETIHALIFHPVSNFDKKEL